MLTAPSNGITENGCILYTTKTTKTRSFARKTRQAPNEKRQGFPCLAVTEGCGRAALLFPVGTSARLLLLSSRFHHLQCLFGVRNQRAVGEPGDELLEFPDGGVPLSGSRKVHGRLELRQFLLGHALAAFLSLPVELGLFIFLGPPDPGDARAHGYGFLRRHRLNLPLERLEPLREALVLVHGLLFLRQGCARGKEQDGRHDCE